MSFIMLMIKKLKYLLLKSRQRWILSVLFILIWEFFNNIIRYLTTFTRMEGVIAPETYYFIQNLHMFSCYGGQEWIMRSLFHYTMESEWKLIKHGASQAQGLALSRGIF